MTGEGCCGHRLPPKRRADQAWRLKSVIPPPGGCPGLVAAIRLDRSVMAICACPYSHPPRHGDKGKCTGRVAGTRIGPGPGGRDKVEEDNSHSREEVGHFRPWCGEEPNSGEEGFQRQRARDGLWAPTLTKEAIGQCSRRAQGWRRQGAAFRRSHTLNQASCFEGRALRAPAALWLWILSVVERGCLGCWG